MPISRGLPPLRKPILTPEVTYFQQLYTRLKVATPKPFARNGRDQSRRGRFGSQVPRSAVYPGQVTNLTNENTNGLLRQYFPKGTDLSRHSAEDLAGVAATLSSRPRKTLGWRTPAEALNEYLTATV